VPEWVFADMGILCAGGVSSGHLSDRFRGPGRISHQRFRHPGDLRRGRGQLDKILSCRTRCPTLQKIVVFDMEG